MLAGVLAMVPALLATLVLIGWDIGSEGLKRLGLASATMNPVTAAGLLGLSLALVLRRYGGRLGARAAWGLTVLAGLIGAAKLADTALHTQFHVDTLLFAGKLAANTLADGTVRPSRIAPNAALCFVTISLALLAMTRRSERAAIVAQLLGLTTGLVALFAVVGYIYGIDAFYVVSVFFPMAMHTAMAFLCLTGFVFVRTARLGLLTPISDAGPAGRTSRALLPAALIVPVGLGWLRQYGARAGFYSPEIGVALMVMVTVLSFTIMIWWTAHLLLAADTQRRRAEADLTHIANHDLLTGLHNRRYFMAYLAKRVAPPRRREEDAFAIAYMDLDGFKQVNDRLGHEAGDKVLREVGAYLRQCARGQRDVVARLGGDEFALVIDGIMTDADALRVATRIVEGMPADISVSMSLGIVVAAARHGTPESLLGEADSAQYAAKHAGKARACLYEPAPA